MFIGVRYDNGKSNILILKASDDLTWDQVPKIVKEDFPYAVTVLVLVPLEKPAISVESQPEAA